MRGCVGEGHHAPVTEGIANGMEYTADDTDDGQPGTISFTVSDPVRDKEVSSGVQVCDDQR